MFKSILAATFIGSLFLSGCNDSTSDQVQRHAQENLSKQGNMVVGMPAINNFFEKKLLKTILEMRDDPKLVTYTYVSDFYGELHLRCNSIGYGIPHATQFTNPQYVVNYQTGTVLPQADPNGLFSPSSAEGTWVLCKDPNSDRIAPIYFEDRVTVSPFRLTKD